MPRVEKPTAHKVIVIESERGWGQKIDEEIYFDNRTEALEFVANYNKDLPRDTVPDWYMMAQYEGQVG